MKCISHLTFSAKTIAIALFAAGLFFVLAAPQYAATGINREINFQGKLTGSDGTNVTDSSYTVVFSIYDQDSGGTALWSETQSVTTTDGIFQVALGSVTPFPADFSFNWDGRYLGIQVGSDSEMTPRIRLTAVPYAFNSERVAGLTVEDTSGNASTSGILKVANLKTLTFNDSFTANTDGLTFAGTEALGLAAGKNVTFGDSFTTSGAGPFTLTAAADGFTMLGGLTSGTSRTLTLTGADITLGSTIKPTSAGALTIQSNGANTLTLDTGGTAGLSIGTGNANAVTIGKSGATLTLGMFSGHSNSVLFSGASGALGVAETTDNGDCLLSQGSSADPLWSTCPGGGSGYWTQTGSDIYYNTGNVGIGTTTPNAKLDVNGNLNVSGTATSSALAVGYAGIGAGTGQAIFSGNVGIGTSAPGSYKLSVNGGDIYGSNNLALGGNIQLTNNTLTDYSSSYLNFSHGIGFGVTSAAPTYSITNAGVATLGSGSNLISSGPTYLQIGSTQGSGSYLRNYVDLVRAGDYALTDGNGIPYLYTYAGAPLSGIPIGSTGIGTNVTSPHAVLDVEGGSTGGNAAFIVNQNGASTNNIIAASSSGNTKFIVDYNGNVGIGVTSPGAFLSLAAATTAKPQINLTTSSGTDVSSPASGDLWWNGTNLYFYNGSTNKDLLAGGGGGGSTAWSDLTAPGGNLSLAMSTYTTTLNWATGTSTNNLFNLTTDSSANGTGYLLNLATGTSSTVKPFHVSAAGTEGLMVDATGNVGIGTTTPNAKLDVNGNLNVSGTATSSALAVGYTGIGAGTGQAIFSGNVGIGTSTVSSYALNVSGDTNISGKLQVGYSGIGTLDLTGAGGTSSGEPGLIGYSSGTITVGGPTNIQDTLSVGGGVGVLDLSSAGAVDDTNSGKIGYDSGSSRLLLGGDSQATGNFYIGDSGMGIIDLTGTASSPSTGQIGYDSAHTAIQLGGNSYVSGNIGIGVTNPGALLSLAVNTTTTPQIHLTSSSGTDVSSPASGDLWWNGTNLEFYNGSTNKDLLAGGGSTSWSSLAVPTTNLSLAMSTDTTALSWATGTSSNNLFSLTTASNANGTGALLRLDSPGTTNSVLPVRITANGTEALAVKADGNVGIGTTNPAQKLDIRGTASVRGGTGWMDFSMDGTTGLFNIGNTGLSSVFKITNNSINVLYANANGNVGIGTTAPGRLLDVNGTGRFSGNGTNNAIAIFNQTDSVNQPNVLAASASGSTVFSVSYGGMASDSAGLTINSAGSVQTTKYQTLTLGGSSTGNITIAPQNGAGVVTIGTSTNGLTFDTQNSGPTYNGTARPTRTITLSPEYAGAVLTAFYGAGTDTSITGAMTSDTDTTPGTSIRNYYDWEATGSEQFYTVAVRMTLPADFSAWQTSNAVIVNYKTGNATSTNSLVDVRLYNENSATIVASSLSNANTSWSQVSFGSSSLTGWATAGQNAVVYLRLGSTSSANYARVGDIVLSYLAKY